MGHAVLKQMEFLMRVKYKFHIHIRPQSKHSASAVLAREVDQLCVEQPELSDVDLMRRTLKRQRESIDHACFITLSCK